MAKERRKSKNETGIQRIEGIPFHDAWIWYTCVNCKENNYELIGNTLLTPDHAYESCTFICTKCGQVHSKDSNLPFEFWKDEHKDSNYLPTQRFWKAFFRNITEHPESYWKQCNCCGSILPFSHFSRHSNWGPLERQMECRSCKAAINAELNPLRTKEQLHESSIRRRIADLFVTDDNQYINHEDLFTRFQSKCFKTGKPLDINARNTWEIDHIMPSLYLWPLTIENAALISKEANNAKKAKWPSEFYTSTQLINLARITGANLELLSSKTPIVNNNIDVNKGISKYLTVRDNSNLQKRIMEIKQILMDYDLINRVSNENKKILGIQ